jgi:hypothetical protein
MGCCQRCARPRARAGVDATTGRCIMRSGPRCMEYWQRQPAVQVHGVLAWRARAWPRRWVRRAAKQARILNADVSRCTRMHADGPGSAGRFTTPTQIRPNRPRRCDGPCPICVHPRASANICVRNSCLLCRPPHCLGTRATAGHDAVLRHDGPHLAWGLAVTGHHPPPLRSGPGQPLGHPGSRRIRCCGKPHPNRGNAPRGMLATVHGVLPSQGATADRHCRRHERRMVAMPRRPWCMGFFPPRRADADRSMRPPSVVTVSGRWPPNSNLPPICL